jgi:hypothetical protein
MKNIIIGALIFILLLVVFAKYSWSGFTSENEYVDLVYKMLSENKATIEVLKALQEKGAPMEKIPTYITMGQMKLATNTSPAPAPSPEPSPAPSPEPSPAPAPSPA